MSKVQHETTIFKLQSFPGITKPVLKEEEEEEVKIVEDVEQLADFIHLANQPDNPIAPTTEEPTISSSQNAPEQNLFELEQLDEKLYDANGNPRDFLAPLAG